MAIAVGILFLTLESTLSVSVVRAAETGKVKITGSAAKEAGQSVPSSEEAAGSLREEGEEAERKKPEPGSELKEEGKKPESGSEAKENGKEPESGSEVKENGKEPEPGSEPKEEGKKPEPEREEQEDEKDAGTAGEMTSEECQAAERSEIVEFALQFEGNPYVYGGTSLTNGADCSGFVMSVFGNFDYELPRVAAAQCESSTKKELDAIEPADLLFYGEYGVDHVAIYIGGGQIIHASTSASGIKISQYDYRTPVAVGTYLE